MRIISAFLLLGLLSSSLAFIGVKKIPSTVIDTSFLKNTHEEKKFSMAKLSSFMQQATQTAQISDFLKGLLQQVAENRKEKLSIIEQTRSQCTDEESFRNQAITEGQRAVTAAQSQLDLCTSQQEQAKHLRDLAASALDVYKSDLEDLNDSRDNQKKTFEDRSQKLTQLQDSLQQLQNLLDDFEAAATNGAPGALFIQTTNKLLKHSVATGHSHLLLPVYTMLLQMHAKQDYNADDVAAIREILVTLAERIGETLQELNSQETQDEQNYNDALARLNGLITRLTNQVSATDQFSANMDQCINQENSILDLSKDKVTRNTDLLAVSQELCKASEEQWRLSELSRTKEVNIINAILGAVNRFQAEFKESDNPKLSDLLNK